MAGLTVTLLRIRTSVSAAADRPASYGNQIISSTRPIAATYICRRSRGGCYQYCRRPSDVSTTDGRTKLTALETISRWLILKKRKNCSLNHPLGHSGVTYALHLWLVGKPVVDFIFVVIELFSLSPMVETLWVEIGRSRRFSKGGWVTLNADFRVKGASPTNHSWYQSSRVIALSCGIKISAVRHVVLSQCMHVTDGGRTELRLPRPPSHMLAR